MCDKTGDHEGSGNLNVQELAIVRNYDGNVILHNVSKEVISDDVAIAHRRYLASPR